MAKLKFTKGELKRERDALKQYEHFLPILELKEQQLQMEIQNVHKKLEVNSTEIDDLNRDIEEWAGLLNEGDDYVTGWVKPKRIETRVLNIAGVPIPILEKVEFEEPEYDLFLTPIWVDLAIPKIRQLVIFLEEEKSLNTQKDILEYELRRTRQRVNLFEKVKIPECGERVRLIKIYLGDQETNAVCRAKIAKGKIESLV